MSTRLRALAPRNRSHLSRLGVPIKRKTPSLLPYFQPHECFSNPQMNTYFGLLAEFGEANIPLEKVAPKYFGLSAEEAKRRAPAKILPCPAFRLGGQKSPWLVSVADLAKLIDEKRAKCL